MTRPHRFLTGFNTTSSSAAVEAESPSAAATDLESDYVVILAALLCALICAVGLLAVARCAWLRRGIAARAAAAANRGLKKKALQSLPRLSYDPAAKVKFAPECAICLTEFADGDEIRVLPQCGHGFHVGCVDVWLSSHSSCPSCRRILEVARCKKCGEFPAPIAGSGARTEAEQKAREDGSSSGFLP